MSVVSAQRFSGINLPSSFMCNSDKGTCTFLLIVIMCQDQIDLYNGIIVYYTYGESFIHAFKSSNRKFKSLYF